MNWRTVALMMLGGTLGGPVISRDWGALAVGGLTAFAALVFGWAEARFVIRRRETAI